MTETGVGKETVLSCGYRYMYVYRYLYMIVVPVRLPVITNDCVVTQVTCVHVSLFS